MPISYFSFAYYSLATLKIHLTSEDDITSEYIKNNLLIDVEMWLHSMSYKFFLVFKWENVACIGKLTTYLIEKLEHPLKVDSILQLSI